MSRSLLTIAFTILFSGCISVGSVRVPESLTKTAPEKTGIVFGSIGSGPESAFTSQRLIFRAKNSEELGDFVFVHDGLTNVSLDFEEGKTRGTVFFARLPAGAYEIVDVRFFINRAQFGSSTFTAREKFSVPFTVRAGQATYLGEFIARPHMGKTLLGIPTPAGGYYVVSDRLARDLAVLKKKEGVGTFENTHNEIVDVNALSLPLFQSGAK